MKRDLVLDPASRFRFDGRSAPLLRLGFSRHDPAELIEAVGRLEQRLSGRMSDVPDFGGPLLGPPCTCASVRSRLLPRLLGLEQGLERGLEQGRHEGRTAISRVLTKLLTFKFGTLSSNHEAFIAEASLEQLERYVERVLTAESIEEVLDVSAPSRP